MSAFFPASTSISVPPRTAAKRLSAALLGWLLAALHLAFPASARASEVSPLPLHNVRSVLSLPHQQAALAKPVALEATVTLFDLKYNLFFVQDDTGGIYVYAPQVPGRTRPGEKIAIKGFTAPGRFSPVIQLESFQTTGSSSLPPPRRSSLERVLSGIEDCQWVELEGVIHSAESKDNTHRAVLALGPSRLPLLVCEAPSGWHTNLVDAEVRVRGVGGTLFNAQDQVSGFHLFVQKAEDIEVIVPPPSDPFALPVRQDRELLTYQSLGLPGHRIKVQGKVTFCRPGSHLVLQNTGMAVVIRSPGITNVSIGHHAEAVGFLSLKDGIQQELEQGLVRIVEPGSPLSPALVNAGKILIGERQNELIRLEGSLQGTDQPSKDHLCLYLESGGRTLRAHLVTSSDLQSLHQLRPGTVLRLTGICHVIADPLEAHDRVELWLRDKNDIQVIGTPAWWTTRTFQIVCLGLLSALVLALCWIMLARHRLSSRAQSLRGREAQLEDQYRDLFENANDLIFECDLQGKVRSFNRAAELTLETSRTAALHQDFSLFVSADQRDLVEQRLRLVQAGQPQDRFELRLQTPSARAVAVELAFKPVYEEGRIVAVRAFGRDITAKKLGEEALRHSERQLKRSISEREQLARDLHDGIIQSIYAVGLVLEDCRRVLPAQAEEAANRLFKATSSLNRIIRDVRNFILGLKPESLNAAGLNDALADMVASFGPTCAGCLRTEIDPVAAGWVQLEHQHHLLQVAREAISNSLRHSNAKSILLSLQRRPGSVALEVRDDGQGFDPDQVQHGQGLDNMVARARELHAQISISSSPHHGTTVTFVLPLKTDRS